MALYCKAVTRQTELKVVTELTGSFYRYRLTDDEGNTYYVDNACNIIYDEDMMIYDGVDSRGFYEIEDDPEPNLAEIYEKQLNDIKDIVIKARSKFSALAKQDKTNKAYTDALVIFNEIMDLVSPGSNVE